MEKYIKVVDEDLARAADAAAATRRARFKVVKVSLPALLHLLS